jgi:aryl-alcohol dehydrogenase-like predicted oxidoreductase
MMAVAQRLGLGTVQFGLPYGVTHSGGQVPEEDVSEILAEASAVGVDTVDTAAGYGHSEDVLGRLGAASRFRTVTKLAAAGPDPDIGIVEAGFHRSLARLQAQAVDSLLVHSAGDLIGSRGDALWQLMERLKGEGLVRRIGVSVYDPAEIAVLATRYPLDLVQLPANVLDQRHFAGGALDALALGGTAIHVRSAFLQGLLLAGAEDAPRQIPAADAPLERWRQACRQARATQLQAALAFLLHQDAIERVIVGVHTRQHLAEIVGAASLPSPVIDWAALACQNPDVIDPRRWPAPPGQ